jgi:hypothetical protein
MDIRWFALQEWIHLDKDIILIHISGEINAADALTKALAWIKHYRHTSHAMGTTGPVYFLTIPIFTYCLLPQLQSKPYIFVPHDCWSLIGGVC